MDQSTLVKDQIDDGRRFIERFAADGNLIQAAFWSKTSEDGIWFLHVVTELIDRVGPTAAYRAVGAALEKLGDAGISGSEIKVISPKSPIAKDVLAVMARHSKQGARINRLMDGNGTIIYPPQFFTFAQANPMTTEDISREILRLMNRGPAVHPSRVALKDGTAFDGVPFSIEVGTQRAMVVRFIADGEASPRTVRLDEIASVS